MTDVAYAGAGSAAFTGAALLGSLGHRVTMWSPGGGGTMAFLKGVKLTSSGAINGEFAVNAVEGPLPLARSADLILAAVPAYAQKLVFDKLLPHLEDRHTVIISGGPLGGGAVYLSKILAGAGKKTRVGLMNGPMIGGRRVSETECATAPFRSTATVAGLPSTDTDAIIATLEEVYGKRFRRSNTNNALEVGVATINGVVHAAQVICNITRIEEGDAWCGYRHTTDSVGRLTEALDVDRIAVAKAFGFDLPDVVRYFDPSGRAKTAQEAIQPIMYHRTFRAGPRNINTRYIEEEIPYNLYVLEVLGTKLRAPTPTITSMIDIYIATRGRNYRSMNIFADEIGLNTLPPVEFSALWENGFRS